MQLDQVSTSGVYSYVDLGWNQRGLELDNAVLMNATDTSATPTIQQALPFSSTWQHVHLVVTRTAPTGHASLTIDGVSIVAQDTHTLAPDTARVVFELGLGTEQGTPAIGVFFDNVAIDVAY